MGRMPTTVGLVAGSGLIARFGAVILFLSGESTSTERMLGAAETAADAPDPGVAIAQRLLATVFTGGSAQPPAFGVVAPTDGGILLLLRGSVRATVDGPEGPRLLSGERAMTWADEIIRDPVRRISILSDGAAPTPIPRTDLRAGVVAGGGFIVQAPVFGLAARENSGSLPKVAAPEPLPDVTRRSPTPTTSHTRISAPIPSSDSGRRQQVSPDPDRQQPSPEHGVDREQGPAEQGGDRRQGASEQPGSRPGDRRTAATTPASAPPSVSDRPVRMDAQPAPPVPNPAGGREPASSPRLPKDPISAPRLPKDPASSPRLSRDPASSPRLPRDPASSPRFPQDPASSPRLPQGPASSPRLAKQPVREPNSGAVARPGERPDPDDQPPTAAYNPEAESFGEAPPPTSDMAAVGGALTGADGAVYPLDRQYVIGRDPMIDEAVRRAAASPIVIPRDRHVSRVHARLNIEQGKVFVRDAGTPGGTFMAAPGAPDWVRVGQRPTELRPGWSLRIGERVLTFRTAQESH
ncbi:FHA domain-containing protein [Nocardia sp. NBC_00511]|uniref:FHA domain-containing protein n=1 Tax=Nocardia sp. NBC_00511 TaxID=2903591 RepID=UPI0030E5DA04